MALQLDAVALSPDPLKALQLVAVTLSPDPLKALLQLVAVVLSPVFPQPSMESASLA